MHAILLSKWAQILLAGRSPRGRDVESFVGRSGQRVEFFCSFESANMCTSAMMFCISVMQMREVLSKRKDSGQESYEEVGNKQDGLCGSSLQDL